MSQLTEVDGFFHHKMFTGAPGSSTEPFLIGKMNDCWISRIYTDVTNKHDISFSTKRSEAIKLELSDAQIATKMFGGLVEYYRVDTFDTDITSLILRQLPKKN